MEGSTARQNPFGRILSTFLALLKLAMLVGVPAVVPVFIAVVVDAVFDVPAEVYE